MAGKFYVEGEARAAKVADLFAAVAPRYDLINDLILIVHDRVLLYPQEQRAATWPLTARVQAPCPNLPASPGSVRAAAGHCAGAPVSNRLAVG